MRQSVHSTLLVVDRFNRIAEVFDAPNRDLYAEGPLAEHNVAIIRAELSRLITVLVASLNQHEQELGPVLHTLCKEQPLLLQAAVWVIANRPSDNDFNVVDAWSCLGRVARDPAGAQRVLEVLLLDLTLRTALRDTAARGAPGDDKLRPLKDNAIVTLDGVLKAAITLPDAERAELLALQQQLAASR